MNFISFPHTKSFKKYKRIAPVIALVVVVFSAGLIAIIGGNDSSFGGIVLEGAGCERSEGAEICEIVSGSERVLLRDCSQQSMECGQSWYELGKKEGNTQYVLLKSDGFQMMTLLSIDTESLEVAEGERYFFTEVLPECENNRNGYEDECFSYALTEEQRQEVWEANQAYLQAEREYLK